MAGGLGTRMKPHTDKCPKTMLPIAGRPFAEWQLEWLASEGVDEVVYLVGHLWHKIARPLGQSFAGITLRYSIEPEPLGKMDAIAFALEYLRPYFAVVYGDSYLPDVNLREMFRTFVRAGGHSTVRSEWEGIDYGLSIYARSTFEHISYPVDHRWYEIGSPDGFSELEKRLLG